MLQVINIGDGNPFMKIKPVKTCTLNCNKDSNDNRHDSFI